MTVSFLSSVLPFDVLSSVPSVPVFLTGLSVSVKTTVSVCLQLLFLSVSCFKVCIGIVVSVPSDIWDESN